MKQLYEFEGAPEIGDALNRQISRYRRGPPAVGGGECFVTGRKLNFNDYVKGAKTPKGGRSSYHVGHITPLTRGGRHISANIAWLSDDGNRIQGNDTIDEIEEKLVHAVCFHFQRDARIGKAWTESEERAGRLIAAVNMVRTANGLPPLE